MSGESHKTRLVITLSGDSGIEPDQVAHELSNRGFVCLVRLKNVRCLLGEFEGDYSQLRDVKGVAAVEPEGEVGTQG